MIGHCGDGSCNPIGGVKMEELLAGLGAIVEIAVAAFDAVIGLFAAL